MANTTNFGWETPDDTDLVKDGAAAIRTLAGAIDTSMVDLKGGTTGQVLSKATNTDMDFTWVAQDDSNAIQNAIIDAKGDLIVGSAADTPARLAVGTNDYVLTADSSATYGVKWASAGGGGLTSIASGSLSSSSLALTSISGAYKHLQLHLKDFDLSGGTGSISMTFMGLTSDYTTQQTGFVGNAANNDGVRSGSNVDLKYNLETILNGDYNNNLLVNFYNYAESTTKLGDWKLYYYARYGGNQSILQGTFNNSNASAQAALTSITVSLDSGRTFGAGTYELFGVK